MKKTIARILVVLTSIMVLITVPVFALNSEDCRIEIHLGNTDSKELMEQSVSIDLYRVARTDSSSKFITEQEFKNDLKGWNIEGYKSIRDAKTQKKITDVAKDCVLNNHLSTGDTANTKQGVAVFDHLESGLYLILVDTVVADENTYTYEPLLIALPSISINNTSTGNVVIHMNASISKKEGNLHIENTISEDVQEITISDPQVPLADQNLDDPEVKNTGELVQPTEKKEELIENKIKNENDNGIRTGLIISTTSIIVILGMGIFTVFILRKTEE